jgi:hypothetical protein
LGRFILALGRAVEAIIRSRGPVSQSGKELIATT